LGGAGGTGLRTGARRRAARAAQKVRYICAPAPLRPSPRAALHFLGAFHASGILFVSDSMAYRPLVPEVVRYMQRYTDFFADLALQEYAFQQHLPSRLAAAIVLAARKSLVIRCARARASRRALARTRAPALPPALAPICSLPPPPFPKRVRAAARCGRPS
jgi:hypothetical protein